VQDDDDQIEEEGEDQERRRKKIQKRKKKQERERQRDQLAEMKATMEEFMKTVGAALAKTDESNAEAPGGQASTSANLIARPAPDAEHISILDSRRKGDWQLSLQQGIACWSQQIPI